VWLLRLENEYSSTGELQLETVWLRELNTSTPHHGLDQFGVVNFSPIFHICFIGGTWPTLLHIAVYNRAKPRDAALPHRTIIRETEDYPRHQPTMTSSHWQISICCMSLLPNIAAAMPSIFLEDKIFGRVYGGCISMGDDRCGVRARGCGDAYVWHAAYTYS
jgi:hypothetical protein